MLVGPGGVLALVVGAWGVLWALRVAPGRSWGALLPGLVAFGALAVAFPLLTAASEGTLGFALAARAADPAYRESLRAETLGVVVRPMAATLFALGTVVVATLLARLNAEPRPDDPGIRVLDVLALGSVLVVTLVGVADLLLLRGTLLGATASAALLPRAQVLAGVAAGCALALIGLSGAMALRSLWILRGRPPTTG